MHFSPNGKTIAGNTSDDTIMLWDANTGQLLNTLTKIKGKLWQIKYSTDGSIIVSSSSEKTTQLWDAETGQLINTLSGISGGMTQHTFQIMEVRYLQVYMRKVVTMVLFYGMV